MKNPVEGERQVYGFLTTDANGIVGPVHPKAMPVLLTSAKEYDVRAPSSEASGFQWPLPADTMKIVAMGEKEDHHIRVLPFGQSAAWSIARSTPWRRC